jgi:hypothetical protein
VSLEFVVWQAGCDSPLVSPQQDHNDPSILYTHSITQLPDDDTVLVNVGLNLEQIPPSQGPATSVWTPHLDDETLSNLAFCGRLEVYYGDGSVTGKDRTFVTFHETDVQATVNMVMSYDPRVEKVVYSSTTSNQYGEESFAVPNSASHQMDTTTTTSTDDSIVVAAMGDEKETSSSSPQLPVHVLILIFVVGLVLGAVLVYFLMMWFLWRREENATKVSSSSLSMQSTSTTSPRKTIMKRCNTSMTEDSSTSSTTSDFSDNSLSEGDEGALPYITEV